MPAMRRCFSPNILAVLLTLPVFGCTAPPAATEPTVRYVRVASRERFVDDSMTLLRELDFPPRSADREAGLITTWPSTGGQWFEWWRSDIHGGYQLAESSLQTVRRAVTVALEPAGSTPDVQRLTVQVDKSRYSAPERQITTASGALMIFSERIPTTDGLRRSRARDEHWIPLGRDALLESALADKIIARATDGVASPPAAGASPRPAVVPGALRPAASPPTASPARSQPGVLVPIPSSAPAGARGG